MASGLFSSIQSLSTKLLQAIRGTTSTLYQQQDPSPPVTDQHKRVRKDLEKMSRMLTRIQAVQQDAEEREIHDRSVRLWLAELRGVACQAEDVLDEFYYEVLKSIMESGDAAIEAYHRDGGTKRKFAEMYTSSSLASYSVTITKVSIPDGMAEKIKDITEKFEEIANARRDLHLREDDGTRLVTGPQILPPTSSHVDERSTFGREEEKEEIISLLDPSNGPDFMVLPIVGMGGFGKTTLAQLVFNDSRIHGLFNKRCWVSVSEDFDVLRLTKAIVESVSNNHCEFSELNKLQDVLKEKIRGHSLFLVLDDVWNEKRNLWERFRVGFLGAKFVRILMTTRNTSVAKIMQTTSPFQLSSLPEKNCWSLFKHFAFGNCETSENLNLHEIGRGIVKKCKGSPLAIKALGGILRYEMDEEKWREILESDISEIDETGEVMPALRLSYLKLPQHLKPCFLYLSMFPKGKIFAKDRVVRLWMAQGYINGNTKNLKTLEEIGSEYFDELLGRSLVDYGYSLHDLIHDLARSISQEAYWPVLENDQECNGPCKVYHLYFTKHDELLGSSLVRSDYCSIRTFISGYPKENFSNSAILYEIACVRALKLSYSLVPDTLSALKHLRYLSIEDDKIESLPESLCRLYHLQTLDMNCHNIPKLPENIKSLINLRFLRLRSDKIRDLPESISLLHNLDTLSIEFCKKLKKLPRSIEQLTKLRVLRLSKYFICNLSSGIGKLTNLKTLSGQFEVMGSDMTRGLGEFRDMNRLSGLMSISGLKNVGNIECSRKANLVSKSNLRKLILNFAEDDGVQETILKYGNPNPVFYIAVNSSTNTKNENVGNIQEGVLESLQPHGNFTELVIKNFRGRRVPPWLLDPSLMPKLTTLTLHFHMDFIFLSPLLGQLLHLKSLQICWSGDTVRTSCWSGDTILLEKYLSNQSNQTRGVIFPSHKKPLSRNVLHLGEWQAGDERCLEKLIINNCPKLWKATIPQKLEVLEGNACGCQEIKFSSPSELKKLSISNCRELTTVYYKSADLPFLKNISLSGCPNLWMLSAIPQKVEVLDVNACGCQEIKFSSPSELKELSISNCKELITVYFKSGDLPFLKRISISGCPNLSMPSTIPQKVDVLDVNGCGCQEIKFSSLSELKKLSITNCRELITIYYKSGDLPFLKNISLSGCPNLSMLMAMLQKVEVLQVNTCGFQEIKFTSPSELKRLSISNCRDLITIYYKSGDLPFLKSISLSGCPNLSMLSAIPRKVEVLEVYACGCEEIKFSSPSELKNLSILDCRELITIYYKSGDLLFLKSISLSRCPNLSILSAIPQKVEVLDVNACGCQEIKLSSASELKKFSISNCRELITIYYESGDLSFLKSISLSRLPNLSMLSAIPQNVEVLDINGCGCQEIKLSSPSELKKLSIYNCRELITVYFESGDLPFLKRISICGCPNLSMPSTIPQTVDELELHACGFQEIKFSSPSKLKKLSISNCRELNTIYYESGDCHFLKSISLWGLPNMTMLSAIPQKVEVLGVNSCGCQEIKFSSPSELKELSISNCRELMTISGCPNLSMLSAIPQKVEVLEVNACGCREIKFSSPSELRKLSIYNCIELITIYYESGDLPFLASISLSKCPNLSMLLAVPEKVEVLDINGCVCQEIKLSLPSELKKLSISNCRELITTYYKSGDLPFLKSISLSGCPNLSMLSAIPQKVEVFEVNACGCQEIKFFSPSELKKLSISNCTELTTIYYKSGDLPFLKSISISGCPNLSMLSAIPQKVEVLVINACGCQEIKFSSPSELRKLSITNCRELITIYYKSGDLPFLKNISLSGCPNLSMLMAMPQKVEVLQVNVCGFQEIKFTSPSELKRLSISNCRELITIYYKSGDLPFLKSISLSVCPSLSMLSAIPQKVEVLEVNGCGCQEITFSSPSVLKKLSVSNCRELVAIYYKSGDLPFLVSISLYGCPNLLMLSAIPQELKQLDIENCGFQEINFSSVETCLLPAVETPKNSKRS